MVESRTARSNHSKRGVQYESDRHRWLRDAGELQPREAPDPKPGDEEILIRVRAAGVNPLDWKIRQGQLRLFLRLRFPYVLGSDIAGEVVSTRILAKRFKAGDPVFAFSDPGVGEPTPNSRS